MENDELARAIAAAERADEEAPIGRVCFIPRDYLRTLVAAARAAAKEIADEQR